MSNKKEYIRGFIDYMVTVFLSHHIEKELSIKGGTAIASYISLKSIDKESLREKLLDILDCAKTWNRYLKGEAKPKPDRIAEIIEKTTLLKTNPFKIDHIINYGPNNTPLWNALKLEKPTNEIIDEWNASVPWPNEFIDELNSRCIEAEKQSELYDNKEISNLSFKSTHPESVCYDLNIEPPTISDWHYLVKAIILFHIAIKYERDEFKSKINNIAWRSFEEENDDYDYSGPEYRAADMEDDFEHPWIIYPIAEKDLAKSKIIMYLRKVEDELKSYGLLPQDIIYMLEIKYNDCYLPIEFSKRKNIRRWENDFKWEDD